ncbi:hypothetical protein FRACYDRAFT_255934, partial [Fragilariopsis cylindrus CCMP1102]
RSEDENVGPRATIALDSGSSIHLFKDAFLLEDIHSDAAKSIGVRTTDSNFRVDDIGRLCNDLNTLPLPSDGYYYYPTGVVNILSLAMVAETKRVVMDSAIDNAIYVFNEDGTYVRFAKTSNGMYCIEVTTGDDNHMVMAHQTVIGESAHFSAIDCRRAAKVRELQEVLACPSDIDLANAVEHNVIGNNPFTRRDIRIAKKIFGPDIPSLKGKTVKRKSKMPEDDLLDVPSYIMKEYTKIHLSMDVMHVNGLKVSDNSLQTHRTPYKPICSYGSRGIFTVVSIEADGAFKSIKHELQGKPYNITLSTCDADRHVETVERQIRFLKERIRAVRMMMPYKRIPKRFTIEMVHKVTMLINSLPKNNGIHSIMSPREIVTGKKFRCPTIKVGQYIQGLTGGTNSTVQERSIDALYIGRADNGSGHTVFKLKTKQVVSVNRVVTIPTSQSNIQAVNDIELRYMTFADNDDDSNASDDDFKIDEEYQDEIEKERKLEEKDTPDNDADPDSKEFGDVEPDSQNDYFQNPIQQHNRETLDNDEEEPIILENRTRSANNGIVNLATTTHPAKQECGSERRKKKTTEDDSVDNDLHDDDTSYTVDKAKVGVSEAKDDHNQPEELVDDNVGDTPKELDSDLGPYWALAHSSHAYVLNTITSYSNIEPTKSTPQYGFNRGLKEFGELGYEATNLCNRK